MLKDRDLLFSGPMVRSLLARTKTETRRGMPCRAATLKPGQRAFVKETWRPVGDGTEFRADIGEDAPGPWRSAMLLPYARARLAVRVVEVAIERLEDLDELGAIAEGVEMLPPTGGDTARQWRDYLNPAGFFWTARESYLSLWDAINGRGSAATNPEVAVIRFTVEAAHG